MPWWMTSVTSTSGSRENWSCEIATSEPAAAAACSSGRVCGVTRLWLVNTTGMSGCLCPAASAGPRTVWSWITSTSSKAL